MAVTFCDLIIVDLKSKTIMASKPDALNLLNLNTQLCVTYTLLYEIRISEYFTD